MDNDTLEMEFVLQGESKNCIIYEPEEGCDVVSKIYVRKSALGVKSGSEASVRIRVTLTPITE